MERVGTVELGFKSGACFGQILMKEGEALDLSLGGARIKSSLEVQPGRQIAVKLIVPGDDTPILIEQARVQWIVDRLWTCNSKRWMNWSS